MGRYRLIRRLAAGGMAEVFLSKVSGPQGFEKVVVVKRILPHLAEDPKFVDMFLTEARLAALLEHPNLVQIFDFGMEAGTHFLAMEYVDGPNLRTLSKKILQEEGLLPLELGARIVSLACEGLAYAHELMEPRTGKPLELLHRDISTDNILVSRTGAVKVVDFGIAKAADVGQRTRSGVLKGKMAYMAPEYLLGEPVDARIDLYALGVVLYELVAGRKPFEAESDACLMRAILYEPPVDIRELRPEVPEALACIISKALARRPQERYPHCRALQADLESFLFQLDQPVAMQHIAQQVRALFPALPADELLDRTLSAPTAPVPVSATQPLPTPPPRASAGAEGPACEISQSQVEPPPLSKRSRHRRALAAGGLLALALSLAICGAYLYSSLEANESALPLVAQQMQPSKSITTGSPEERPEPAAANSEVEQAGAVAGDRLEKSHEAAADVGTEEQRRPEVDSTLKKRGEREAVVSSALQPEPAQKASMGASKAVDRKAVTGSSTPPEPRTPPAPSRVAHAMLTVRSDMMAQIYIEGRFVGSTPTTLPVEAGRMLKVEVSGRSGASRFDKSKDVSLKEGERGQVMFNIQKVRVEIRGHPSDMKVVSIDGQPLNGVTTIIVYEGMHSVRLFHVPTGQLYESECEVRPGDKLCRLSVRLKK